MSLRTIDNILQHNPYMKNLSEADRLTCYNEALKRIDNMKGILYTNQKEKQTIHVFDFKKLESSSAYDSTLVDDLYEFTEQERILIYNMVQSRIAQLRILQSNNYYVISNTRGILRKTKIFTLNLIKSVKDLAIKEKIKRYNFGLKKIIADVYLDVKEKVYSFNLTKAIYNTLVSYPVIYTFSLTKLVKDLIFSENITRLNMQLIKSVFYITADNTKEAMFQIKLQKSIELVDVYSNLISTQLSMKLNKTIISL